LQHNPAVKSSLLGNLQTIPDEFVVRGHLEILALVWIEFPNADPSSHPIVLKLTPMPSRRNRDTNEPVFRIPIATCEFRLKPAPALALRRLNFSRSRDTP